MRFPHCDQRVLHRPGECRYCDLHPEWQELRERWGIAFTGHSPGAIAAGDVEGQGGARSYGISWKTPATRPRTWLPCPADFARPPTGAGSDHRRWAGNVATTQVPVNESATSRTLYHHDQITMASQLATARARPGFLERLKANMAKHKDLLDRLR